MSKYPAFLLYVDKFVQGTLTLTAEETGAYILLLCYQWDNNYLPLDEKKLKLIARLSGRNATNVLRTVLEKFQLIDNVGYSNKRLEVERKNYIEKRGKNVERAVNAANARWNNDANSNATSIQQAKHKQCLDDAITNTITITNTSLPNGKQKYISNDIYGDDEHPSKTLFSLENQIQEKKEKKVPPKKERKEFQRPSLEDVKQAMLKENKENISTDRIALEAEKMFLYYEEKNWKDVKDLNGRARRWLLNVTTNSPTLKTQAIEPQASIGYKKLQPKSYD